MITKQPSLDKLKSTLITSGLQVKDNPLYQVINGLITAVQQFQNITIGDINDITNNINNIIIDINTDKSKSKLGLLISNNEDEDSLVNLIPGPRGFNGIDGLRGPPGVDADEPNEPIVINGKNGIDGIDGKNGIPGINGLDADELAELSFVFNPFNAIKAAGLNTQIQYNNNGSFGASANFTWDNPNLALNADGSAVFNESGADKDFRIEGDTESNLFFVDASVDRIGIRTSTPRLPLELLATGSAFPATSGATQSVGGALRIFRTGGTAVCDIGTNGGGGAWIQSASGAELATQFPLLLNPNPGTGATVAIGTTVPTDLNISLDVAGKLAARPLASGLPGALSGGTTGAQFYAVHPSSNWGFLITRAFDDTGSANLALYHTRNVDASIKTVLANGDGLGRITFQGVTLNAGTVNAGAMIQALITGTVSDGVMPTDLIFYTGSADVNSNPTTTERLRITSVGNISINRATFGTSAAGVIGLLNGTAPTTSPADGIQTYAIDNNATSELFARNEAGQISQLTGLRAYVATQFDKTTNVTLANITGLTVNLLAGKVYNFEVVLFVTADAAGGSQYAMAGTATATSIIYNIELLDDATNGLTISSKQTALAGSAGQSSTVTGRCRISGTIVVNAAGTLTVQFAENVSSGTSSVLVGSSFLVWNIT